MERLDEFMQFLSGNFDNSKQYEEMQKNGVEFPFAEHTNTVCNDKITGLPKDFAGQFLVEESRYTTQRGTNSSSHLFLFTPERDGILLTSYEIPAGYEKATFAYETMGTVAFSSLKPSEKFTPTLFCETNGVWEGASESMFTPVVKFSLHERFSAEKLEVSESMEVGGKRTFGYDEAIVYRRKG